MNLPTREFFYGLVKHKRDTPPVWYISPSPVPDPVYYLGEYEAVVGGKVNQSGEKSVTDPRRCHYRLSIYGSRIYEQIKEQILFARKVYFMTIHYVPSYIPPKYNKQVLPPNCDGKQWKQCRCGFHIHLGGQLQKCYTCFPHHSKPQ